MLLNGSSEDAAPVARLAKGTPVVSLGNGATLGEIDHVYFDPERLVVLGFTFHQGGGLFGGERCSGLVDIADVHGFGPDAVTVDDVSVIRSEVAIEARRADLVDLESLLRRAVMTDGGVRLGRVTAIHFGDASYRLTGLDVAGDGDAPDTIPAADIQTIGDEWIIVADPSAVSATVATRKPLRVVTTRTAEGRVERRDGEAVSA